jgi:hypothetical protein
MIITVDITVRFSDYVCLILTLSSMPFCVGKISVLAAAQDQRVAALCLLDPVDNTGTNDRSEVLRA